jgi:nucleotide-binding universal stress UspA family protein
LAEVLARNWKAELILLGAVEHDAPGGMREYLRSVSEDLGGSGLKVRWQLWEEEPLTAIARAVKQERVDLIVMATHGRRGLSRWLLGSVAAGVVRSAHVPVLLVRGQLEWRPGMYRRILIPLDGSEAAEAILHVVERLAHPTDTTVTLLQVIEPLPTALQAESPFGVEEVLAFAREDSERYLAKVAEPLRQSGWQVETLVCYGKIAKTIVDLSKEGETDLVAMVTHGRAGLERLFLGSVSEAVLGRSPIPVLLFLKGEEK